MKPFLSICIPVYNGEKYIASNLDILLYQIKKDKITQIEILVSDNCSTDNTQTIVEKYVKQYPNIIRYNRNSSNILFNGNIMKCCELAKSEYIHFLGDDDFYVEHGILRLLNIIKKQKDYSVIVLSNSFQHYNQLLYRTKLQGEGQSISQNEEIRNTDEFLTKAGYHLWCCSDIVIKKEFIRDFTLLKYTIPDWVALEIALYAASKKNWYYVFSDAEPIVCVRTGLQVWLNPDRGPAIYLNLLKSYDFTKKFGFTKKQINILNQIWNRYVPIIEIRSTSFFKNLKMMMNFMKYTGGKTFYSKVMPKLLFTKETNMTWSNEIYSKLDIFVLTYNRADYLKSMLESLCMQTANGFTIKVLDNASTDHTDIVIQEIQKKYPNRQIIHIKNEKNIGNPNNFKKSQELASNEYTAVFHDDDIIHPEYIEIAMKLLSKHPRTVMLSSYLQESYNPSNYDWLPLDRTYYLWSSQQSATCQMLVHRLCFASMIYKTTAYKKIQYEPEKYGKIMDLPFILQMSKLGDTILLTSLAIRYRQHAMSDSNNPSTAPTQEQLLNFLHTEKKYLSHCKTLGLYMCCQEIYRWLSLCDISFKTFFKMCYKKGVFSYFQYKLLQKTIFRKILQRFFRIWHKKSIKRSRHKF